MEKERFFLWFYGFLFCISLLYNVNLQIRINNLENQIVFLTKDLQIQQNSAIEELKDETGINSSLLRNLTYQLTDVQICKKR